MKKSYFLTPLLAAVILLITSASVGSRDFGRHGSAGSGDDVYFEQTMTKTNGSSVDTVAVTKTYLSGSGKMRVEMDVATESHGRSPVLVILGSADKPNLAIIVDDNKKTYALLHMPDSVKGALGSMKFNVTRVGNERMAGYNCVHARIIAEPQDSNSFMGTDTVDLWQSMEVPLASTFEQWMDHFNNREHAGLWGMDALRQLKQLGCEGFMVKLFVRSKEVNITSLLTKVEKRTLPDSLFNVPVTYKQLQ